MNCPKCDASLQSYGAMFACANAFAETPCDYREVRREFKLRDERLYEFKDAMQKLARRAKRIGCAPVSYQMGEPIDESEMDYVRELDGEIKHDATGTPIKAPTGRIFRYWPVTISGEAPRYHGWTFAATIQHLTLEDGSRENIVRSIFGEVSLVYRERGPECDHCAHKRARRDTFIVRREDGSTKQVGSSCIRDFLGHESPASIAAMAEMLAEAIGAGEAGEGMGGHGAKRFSPSHYLTFVSAVMRRDGWVSKKTAGERNCSSTAALAMYSMDPPRTAKREKLVEPSDTDQVRADSALEWARTLHESGAELPDYLHNVNVIARSTCVPERGFGICASVIVAWERAMGQERERSQARLESKHVGKVKDRLVLTVEIVSTKEIASNYGCTTLHLMRDASGNRFKWFASGGEIGEVGATVTIKGTVKAHEEYHGVAQTVLSRCELYVPSESRIDVPLEDQCGTDGCTKRSGHRGRHRIPKTALDSEVARVSAHDPCVVAECTAEYGHDGSHTFAEESAA